MIRDLSSPYVELNNSNIGQLLTSTFATQSNARMWLTTHSFDVDQPGITPWLYDGAISTYTQASGHPELAPFAAASGNIFPGLNKGLLTLFVVVPRLVNDIFNTQPFSDFAIKYKNVISTCTSGTAKNISKCI